MNEQRESSGIPGYLIPHLGGDGVWTTAGALAIKESLSLGSMAGVMDILDSMSPKDMASMLRESGFLVSAGVVEKGRAAVMGAIGDQLAEAVGLRVDGFGLKAARAVVAVDLPSVGVGQVVAAHDSLGAGDGEALKAIQDVLRAGAVAVDLFGDAAPGERGSLVFVAGQALQKGLQGFGFDGIAGKYEVLLSMSEVAELHKDASRSVAEESARYALGVWAAGGKVSEVSEWVPDSVQRLLYGSLSMATASAVVNAIEGGMVGRHADVIGAHGFARLLAEQGFDVNSATVDVQAADLGLVLVEPDTVRGQYVGPVVGLDHRSALIKYAREKAVELPFKALADGQERPGLGGTVRMKFKDGVLAVSVAEKMGRGEVGR